MRAMSIDPGAVHCGVAMWIQQGSGKWLCGWAVEVPPDRCVDMVEEACRRGQVDLVALEGFWLRPGFDALRQAGSRLETVEVIGAIRHTCRRTGMTLKVVANGQDAIRKKLNSRGYKWAAHGHGDHAHDAEAVGYRGLGLTVGQLET